MERDGVAGGVGRRRGLVIALGELHSQLVVPRGAEVGLLPGRNDRRLGQAATRTAITVDEVAVVAGLSGIQGVVATGRRNSVVRVAAVVGAARAAGPSINGSVGAEEADAVPVLARAVARLEQAEAAAVAFADDDVLLGAQALQRLAHLG